MAAMTAVQIAGCSAAGKSTVAAVLAARGLRTLDADADPRLARMTDRAGAVVPDTPAAPGLDWLGRHDWTWDAGRGVTPVQPRDPSHPARASRLARATRALSRRGGPMSNSARRF